MNDEISKNKKLEEENKKIKNDLNKLTQNQLNEINKLKTELEKYKKENERLNNELMKANKIIFGLKNNQIDNNELKQLREENVSLKYKLTLKDNEIQDLKNKLQNSGIIEEQKVNYKDIIVITFISKDSTVHYGMKCLPTDIFAEVEEKLYKKFENLRNTNNTFTANAKPVLRFKKICENNIKDGDIIQFYNIE